MNAPRPRVVAGNNAKPEFFNAVSYEVEAIFEATLHLALPVADLRGATRDRQLASLKINADRIKATAGQIVQLATHLSGICDRESKS